MQYVLTDEEMKNLVPIGELEEAKQALRILRNIIVEQAKYDCGISFCNKCPIYLKADTVGYKLVQLVCPNMKLGK